MAQTFTLPFSPVYLLLIALWVLPWKGYALWKSARIGDQKWFLILLIVNSLAILEIIYIFWVYKRKIAGMHDGSVLPGELPVGRRDDSYPDPKEGNEESRKGGK